MFKTLIDRNGLLFSITFQSRAFYFFVSRRYLGAKTAPTTDPYPGIVEMCDYDIDLILKRWPSMSNLKVLTARRNPNSPLRGQRESN